MVCSVYWLVCNVTAYAERRLEYNLPKQQLFVGYEKTFNRVLQGNLWYTVRNERQPGHVIESLRIRTLYADNYVNKQI